MSNTNSIAPAINRIAGTRNSIVRAALVDALCSQDLYWVGTEGEPVAVRITALDIVGNDAVVKTMLGRRFHVFISDLRTTPVK